MLRPVLLESPKTCGDIQEYAEKYAAMVRMAVLSGWRPLTKKDADILVGGISDNSKMAGKSFGLPAILSCPIGSQLATLPNSVCSECYCDERGRYVQRIAKAAQRRRMAILQWCEVDLVLAQQWVQAMVLLIGKDKLFRWLDSGDIFSVHVLTLILKVARYTPKTKHWVPTKESVYWNSKVNQDNVCFRMSGYRIGHRPKTTHPVALVSPQREDGSATPIEGCFSCPAYTKTHKELCELLETQGCGPCTACYDKTVDIVYPMRVNGKSIKV